MAIIFVTCGHRCSCDVDMGRCESSCKDLPLIKSFHILYMPHQTDEIQQIINAYDEVVKGIDSQALDPTSARAYGGIIRAGKGALTERIFHQLVILAWTRLGKIRSPSKLKDKLSEYLLISYIEKIKVPEI